MKLVPTRVRYVVLATIPAAAMLGCQSSDQIFGVEVNNRTGQILNVTHLKVEGDGSTRPFATTVLARNGTATARTSNEEYRFGQRVRFSIPDRAPDDQTAHVELKLPDSRVRDFDLVIVNGRLAARENVRGRASRRSATPSGQN